MDYVNPVTDTEAWRDLRMEGVGGSEASILLGWNEYDTPDDLWRKKVGVSTKELSYPELAWWGNHLEFPVLAAYAMRQEVRVLCREWRGKPVVIHPDGKVEVLKDDTKYIPLLNPVQHTTIPFMRANVDGYVLDDDGKVVRGLEAKTGTERAKRKWNWYAPLSYIAQVHHNAMCVESLLRGRKIEWDLVALIGGNHFGIVPVTLDAVLQDEIVRREQVFWGFVRTNTPIPDGFFDVLVNDLWINENEPEL